MRTLFAVAMLGAMLGAWVGEARSAETVNGERKILFVANPREATGFQKLWVHVASATMSHFVKELKVSYFYDLDEDGAARSKAGLSTTLVSAGCISADPVWIYTPDKSDEIGEIGMAFPISLSKIPIGKGKTVGDWFREEFVNGAELKKGRWIDNLYAGPYMTHNFMTGRFGYGGMAGIKLF